MPAADPGPGRVASIAIIAVAVLYSRSIAYPFIGFDDTTLIADNQVPGPLVCTDGRMLVIR